MNHKYSVLCLDDSDIIHIFLKDILSSYNSLLYFQANNSTTCYKILGSEKIDLILLDINLEDENGFDICKNLKSSEKYSSIPIIFLTGSDNTQDIVKAFEIGCSDYISKPFIGEVLVARINVQIQLKKLLEMEIMQKKIDTVKNLAITYNHRLNGPLSLARTIINQLKSKDENNTKSLLSLENCINEVIKFVQEIRNLNENIVTERYHKDVEIIDLKRSK